MVKKKRKESMCDVRLSSLIVLLLWPFLPSIHMDPRAHAHHILPERAWRWMRPSTNSDVSRYLATVACSFVCLRHRQGDTGWVEWVAGI